MNDLNIKPRLVYFQWRHDGLPQFLQLHMQLHVKCLAHFFDVVVINHDCNYDQVCEMYRPDLTLFESGYRSSISKKLKITHTNTHPHIPKLGLHNGDPWCDFRVGFISDMAHWGIESYFSISTTIAEHTPELADNLFVWPNFIDPDVYKDYQQDKVIPVLFNGYINALYPWRQKIYDIVSKCYPSLVFPHLGYEHHSPIMIHGKEYARTINASWFVPACGTLAKEVVRKHFEIPGSRSCLITEWSPMLEAAGFADMQNCVFANENDVLDKMGYLYRNKEELTRITDAGYRLVHSRHTLQQRNQIYQWYMLNRNLNANQKIIQTNPFGPLQVVEKSRAIKDSSIKCSGLNLELLHAGDEKLWVGEVKDAEALYRKCLSYIHWMCEPKLKLAICNLLNGNATQAMQWLCEPMENNFRDNRAFDPDPVEWAYFIICLLCKGRLNEAVIRVSQFPALPHPELDRVKQVVAFLNGQQSGLGSSAFYTGNVRKSIHELPSKSFSEWLLFLCKMLSACGQERYASKLQELANVPITSNGELMLDSRSKSRLLQRRLIEVRIKWLRGLKQLFTILNIPDPRPGFPPISETEYLMRLARVAGLNKLKPLLQIGALAKLGLKSILPTQAICITLHLLSLE